MLDANPKTPAWYRRTKAAVAWALPAAIPAISPSSDAPTYGYTCVRHQEISPRRNRAPTGPGSVSLTDAVAMLGVVCDV